MKPLEPTQHRKLRKYALVALVLYLGFTAVAIGIRTEHFVISGLFGAFFWMSPSTARFALLALPFLGVGVTYENLPRLFHLRPDIHVSDLYQAEIAIFSVKDAGETIIYPTYFERYNWPAVDFVAGVTYMLYLAQSFILAGYLFFRDQTRLLRFALAFLLVNIMGQIAWILWPAAPPWYVTEHGLGPAVLDALPRAAGAARFDALFGINLFGAFYARSSNVFGAMPSLHCAYPTLVALTVAPFGKKWVIPATCFVLLMMFSAVYLQHHYVLDVIAGVIFAGLAHGAIVLWGRMRSPKPIRASEARQEDVPCQS